LSVQYPLRPNHARSVEIFGEFTHELACCLASKIAALQAESDDPITVYINSDGGSVRVLDILHGLLGASAFDRGGAQFITVAVGDAYSAAANILAFGYYAYAYRHSIIHFHGVRTRELPDTFESATQTVTELQKTNRTIARKLSRSMIARIVFRYQALQSKFRPGKYRKDDGHLADLHCFLDLIHSHLSSRTRQLIWKTFEHVSKSSYLSGKIVSSVKFTKRTSVAAVAADDSRVLQAVVKHELKENKKNLWRLDERGMNQIVSDYLIIREYHFGSHLRLLDELLKAFGILFLTATEQQHYVRMKKEDKKREYLQRRALPKLNPLWFFIVSLCNFLMEGENHLTPTDAYYIGAIDEVIGTKMTGRRVLSEQKAKTPVPVSSPTPSPSTSAS